MAVTLDILPFPSIAHRTAVFFFFCELLEEICTPAQTEVFRQR